MKQAVTELSVQTRGKGLYDVTRTIEEWARNQGIRTGLLTIFIRHTSASLAIQENADPDVLSDLNDFLGKLVPDDDRLYRHTTEGPDDMPAHIRTMLTQTQLSIPIVSGRPALGTWQGVYVFEHRAEGHHRHIVLHIVGD